MSIKRSKTVDNLMKLQSNGSVSVNEQKHENLVEQIDQNQNLNNSFIVGKAGNPNAPLPKMNTENMKRSKTVFVRNNVEQNDQQQNVKAPGNENPQMIENQNEIRQENLNENQIINENLQENINGDQQILDDQNENLIDNQQENLNENQQGNLNENLQENINEEQQDNFNENQQENINENQQENLNENLNEHENLLDNLNESLNESLNENLQGNINQQAHPAAEIEGAHLIQQYANEFLIQDTSGRSAEFIEVRNALHAVLHDVPNLIQNDQAQPGVRHESIIDQIKTGHFTFGTDKYKKMLRLNEALEVYRRGHLGASSPAGDARMHAANFLYRFLSVSAARMLQDNNAYIRKPTVTDITRKQRNTADDNTKEFVKYYRRYCKTLEGNMIYSYKERLRMRWNALKTCERDILIMIDTQKAKARFSDEQAYLRYEYESVRAQIQLMDYSKDHGEEQAHANPLSERIHSHAFEMMGKQDNQQEEKGLKNSDQGLSKEQLAGLQQIDAWVLRNLQNGGYMTLGLNTTDRTDFATKLFSLSKRERLYIYYLVETRERVAPTPGGFAESQVTYEPDLSVFRDRMVASKLKFYTRFSGGYVYWNKLSEAMAIAGQIPSAFNVMDEIQHEEHPNADIPVDDPRASLTQERHENLKQLLKNLTEEMKLRHMNEKKDTPQATKEENRTRIEQLTNQRNQLMGELQNIQHKIEEKQGKDAHIKNKLDTTEKFTGEVAFKTQQITKIGTDTTKQVMGTDYFVNDMLNKYTYSGINGLVGLSALTGLVSGIINLINNHSKMTNTDMLHAGGNILLQAGYAFSAGVQTAKLFTDSAFLTTTTAPVVGVGLWGAATVLNGVKTVSYLVNGYRRTKAAEYARQLGGQDKFRSGMLKLNETLAKRQRISSLGGLFTSGSATAVSALVMASALNPAFGIAMSGIGLTAGLVLKMIDHSYMKKMRSDMNNSFFEMDTFMEQAVASWEQEHPDKHLDAKQKEKLKNQVMRKMAADLGYYSPNHLATAVAGKFAQYLWDGAREGGAQGDMCKMMIKGLGLYLKIDNEHPENSVPTVSDITQKLCG